MVRLQDIALVHPGGDALFQNISLHVSSGSKLALIGNNGTGKSTMLRIKAGDLAPTDGTARTDSPPWYVPQHFGQYNHLTIAGAMGAAAKLSALLNILRGHVSEAIFADLADDWTVEERCLAALDKWGMAAYGLWHPLDKLSGGEKTRVFLAGIDLHAPQLILLDEPTNHLDNSTRALLLTLVNETRATIIMVSHDRTLLRAATETALLTKTGLRRYGGNYDLFAAQKDAEDEALKEDVLHLEKALRKSKAVARETAERQQKLDARAAKKGAKAGIPTIAINTLRNNAEKSTAKLKEVHAGKMAGLADELQAARDAIPDPASMRFNFTEGNLHRGKLLFAARGVKVQCGELSVWSGGLTAEIRSGMRIAVSGTNGSGKTSFLRLVQGLITESHGTVRREHFTMAVIDQDYSLLKKEVSVFDQAAAWNQNRLEEHVVRNFLARFLFRKEDLQKKCDVLSGGERMRLALCCLWVGQKAPDLLVLDEPTNNLDLQNILILQEAVRSYAGTLLLVSHDEAFLQSVGIRHVLDMAHPDKGLQAVGSQEGGATF